MSTIRLLSTSGGDYRYRLHGRVEVLPLRPNHFWGEGGISSLSYPEVIRRGRRRITYVYKGRTWVGLYAREGGVFALTSSYSIPEEPSS